MRCVLLVAATCCVVIPVNGQKPDANQKPPAQTQGPNSTISVDTANTGQPSYIRRLIAPENLPNLVLCLVGIAGVAVAIRTINAIRTQTALQKVGMQQWVITGEWKQRPRYADGLLAEIMLSIPILNETNYPFTLESVIATLNRIEQTKTVKSRIAPLGKDAHIVSFAMRMENQDIAEYQQNQFTLVIACRVTFIDVFKDTQSTTFNRLYRCGPQEFEREGTYTQG